MIKKKKIQDEEKIDSRVRGNDKGENRNDPSEARLHGAGRRKDRNERHDLRLQFLH